MCVQNRPLFSLFRPLRINYHKLSCKLAPESADPIIILDTITSKVFAIVTWTEEL